MKYTLYPTDISKLSPKQQSKVDEYAFMIADKMMEGHDSYILMYIQKKPRWLPKILHRWCIKKLLFVSHFLRK